jgi:hypothetical protein
MKRTSVNGIVGDKSTIVGKTKLNDPTVICIIYKNELIV